MTLYSVSNNNAIQSRNVKTAMINSVTRPIQVRAYIYRNIASMTRVSSVSPDERGG